MIFWSFTNLLYFNPFNLTVKYCIWSRKFHKILAILRYSQDPLSKASWVLFQLLCITWELPGWKGTYFLMGVFDLMFSKNNSMPSSFSHSRIRRKTPNLKPSAFRYSQFNSENNTLPLQGWKQIFFNSCTTNPTSNTQNTNCLYHSSPFLSLVFSSWLLGDQSLLPKLSLPHSSRIADYMQKKNNNQANYNQRMRKITKKRY